MMGTWMAETRRKEKEINILNRIVHLVGLIYEMKHIVKTGLETVNWFTSSKKIFYQHVSHSQP
jgi:hypothetical protein